MTNDNSGALRNLILDMDGVLWRGETPLPGLVSFFETLDELQIKFVLATNNATRVATQYAEKLQRFGISVSPEAILTSAEATAAYLQDRVRHGASAYVVGEEGLRGAMEAKGFRLLAADAAGGSIDAGARADIVVVGFTRHACYSQLARAVYLVNNGALFVGTNPDVTFPHEVGPLPGAGAYLAFIQAATNRQPIVVGKPGGAIFEEALRRLDARKSETAMVGDRLETDIAGAQAAGLKSILLLSGVTNRQALTRTETRPDFVFENLHELSLHLKSQNQHAPQGT